MSTTGNQRLFSNVPFARLFAGEFVSQLGTAFSFVALMSKYKEIHGSADGWPWVAAVQTLPFVAFGMLFGYLADRGMQRSLLVISDLGRAVLFVALARCSSEAAFFALAFGVAVFNSAFEPAFRSIVRKLVSPRQLLAANAMHESTVGVVSIAGIGLAGVVLGVIGTRATLLLDAGSYFVSAMNTLTIARLGTPRGVSAEPEGRAAAGQGLRVRLLEGFVALSQLPYPAALLLLLAFVVGFESPLFFPLVEDNGWGGVERVGYIYAVASAGVLVTSLILSRLEASPLRNRRALAVVLAVDASTVLAFCVLRTYALVLPIAFLLGVAESLLRTYSVTEIQGKAEQKMVGRVFAAIGVLSKTVVVAASVAAGLLLQAVGARRSFAVAAILEYTAAALTLALAMRTARR